VKAVVADTGGLLRALARAPDGRPAWPDHEAALRGASAVIVPALVLPEVDYFLRAERAAMRKLVAEILDPRTRYELELPTPADLARAIELDARFAGLGLGLVDGTVAAVAERRRVWRVLTTDR
jgi:predicted nucleic acid-binding protein